MASGIARGSVRMTTTESRKMATIEQLKRKRRNTALVYSFFFDTGHQCYGQLTPSKEFHITGSGFELFKVSCFLKWTADQALVCYLDHRLMSG